MNNTDMSAKIAYIKSCITRQGFITGFTIARLFDMKHELFHSQMCDYYAHHFGVSGQPTIYRQDKNGFFLPTVSTFPYSIETMRVDLGDPTYGFELKHLSDLAAKFPQNSEIIENIRQAFEEYESK